MKQIKFSHDYPKLWGQSHARLIAIELIENIGSNLSPDLIEYDTKNVEGEYYKLSDGKLIQLIFLGSKNIPFCTLRSYNPQKYEYYKNSIGEQFSILIKEKQ